MFDPLPMPEEMALWDRLSTAEYGICPEMLMENACREALAVLRRECELAGKTICLLAGPGNNGGDAFGLARALLDCGARPLIMHTASEESYQGAAAYHLALAKKVGVEIALIDDPAALSARRPDIIIDGLLGTGFKGPLRGMMFELVNIINSMSGKSFILALDIPSGLNGRTGRAEPEAVRADATVAFHAAKFGLAMPEAAEYVGGLHVRRIGIPKVLEERFPPRCRLMTRAGAMALMPAAGPNMHKGEAGHVLVIGGSRGLAGAPLLAGLGALRGGAGLVTLACPGALAAQMRPFCPEIMVMPLGEDDIWSARSAGRLKELLERVDALVVGPGLGRAEEAGEFLLALLSLRPSEGPPMVLDADGLYWLAVDEELKKKIGPLDVLTPHPGEMARLLNTTITHIQDNRLESVAALASELGAACLLKGAATIIAGREKEIFVSPFAAPNLAVGGSGDVLSGLIGSLISQKLSPLQAACLGVYWHGLCGVSLRAEFPCRGNLAGDIARQLPHCWHNTPTTIRYGE